MVVLCSQNAQGQSIKKYVKTELNVVKSVDPNDTDFDDLKAFGEAVGDAHVVLLGEQNHWDATAFEAKIRLIKFLHEELDFEVLAFESDFYALNRATTDSGITRGDLLKENIYVTWSMCVEMAPLFDYVDATTNTNNPLLISGFDCRHSEGFTQSHYVAAFEEMFNAAGGDLTSSDYGKFASTLTELMKQEYESTASEQEQQHFMKYLDSLSLAIQSKTFEDKSFWTQELISLKSGAEYSWNGIPLNTRDAQMADNLEWLVKEKYAGKKVIVWAHNFHIVRKHPEKSYISEPWMRTMGMHLDTIFGDSMYVLGFTSSTGIIGTYLNPEGRQYDGPAINSFERWIINAEDCEYAFVDFNAFTKKYPSEAPQFKMKGIQHSAGKGEWATSHNGVFYIKTISPCNKVP